MSFSLYGDGPLYLRGAVENARLVPIRYPGWTARFYVSEDIRQDLVAELEALGAEIFRMHRRGRSDGMFWRFLAADDRQADAAIFRDADSRISQREVAAVSQWLASGKAFHIMRYHPNHNRPVMGVMWGVRRGALPPIPSRYRCWRRQHLFGADLGVPKIDQTFLRATVNPTARYDSLVHSEFAWFEGESPRPFPEPSQANGFIGQIVKADGSTVPIHSERREQASRPLEPTPVPNHQLFSRPVQFVRGQLDQSSRAMNTGTPTTPENRGPDA